MSAFDIHKENLKVAVPTLNDEKPLIMRILISIDGFVLRVKEKLE